MQITADEKDAHQLLNTAGAGVTMNNRQATGGGANAISGDVAAASTARHCNNSKMTAAAAVSNNLQDVQKLQQELQEIKEQVTHCARVECVDTYVINPICVFSADDVPGVLRSEEEHGVPVRPRHVPDVRRSDCRLSDLPAFGGEAHHSVLNTD